MEQELRKIICKHALKNAIEHNGVANAEAVLKRVIAELKTKGMWD